MKSKAGKGLFGDSDLGHAIGAETQDTTDITSTGTRATTTHPTSKSSADLVIPKNIVPYYEQDGIAIIHGDCRQILPIACDAIVTDPPYGVGVSYASYDDTLESWFDLMNMVVPLMRSSADFVVMPSCAINRLGWWYQHHLPDWLLAWHKGSPGHVSKIGFNDWEPHLAWGRPKRPMHDYWSTVCGFDTIDHPCPKPAAWGNWLVARAADAGELVVDPFMGSGVVLRSAKDLGRKAIGIEIEEKYCEIAAKRLSQSVMDFGKPLDSEPES